MSTPDTPLRRSTRIHNRQQPQSPPIEPQPVLKTKRKPTQMSRRNIQPLIEPQPSLLGLKDGVQPTMTVINLLVSLAVWRVIDQIWTNFETDGIFIDWTYLSEQIDGWNMLIPVLINQAAFLFVYTLFGLELIIDKVSIPKSLAAYYFIITVLLTGPLFMLRFILPSYTMIHGLSVSMQMAIHVMKAHSYFWTNRELAKDKENTKYPSNVTISNYTYWLYTPTFCYYPHFQRSPSRSWSYMLGQILVTGVSFFILYVTLIYDVFPVIELLPADPLGMGSIVTSLRLLVRLGIPMLIFIISFFTGLFHGMMNLIAEFLRFADRTSYKDWWNVSSMGGFWRRWNYRVHEWAQRHLYLQTMEDMSFSRPAALITSFLVTALFHEYVFLVAFKKLQFWTTFVMLAQILLMFAMRHDVFHKTNLGNLLIIAGIPLGLGMLLCVYIEYYLTNGIGLPIQQQ